MVLRAEVEDMSDGLTDKPVSEEHTALRIVPTRSASSAKLKNTIHE